MRILSKYKDYYDYLKGIYGKDPLIVLDRREYKHCPYYRYDNREMITFFIGGYKIEGYFLNDNFYYGEKLHQIGEKCEKDKHFFIDDSFNKKDYENLIEIKTKNCYSDYVNKTIIKDVNNYNEKTNCPILFAKEKHNHYEFVKYPILSDYNLGSFINAEEVYKMISDWISLQKTKQENKIDFRSDIQKLEGKGFDKKTSFRPKIKI